MVRIAEVDYDRKANYELGHIPGAVHFCMSGSIKWRGSHFYSTASNGKLVFPDNVVGLFEVEMDVDGNVSGKIWEWK
jgi:hypothetical protein